MNGFCDGYGMWATAGPFPLNKPGVFWDSVRFHAFDPLSVDGDRPLAAVHTNRWPDNSSADSYPLASRDGFLMHTLASANVANSCPGDPAEVHEHNLLTTIDVVGSSSGGALLVEDTEETLPDGTGGYLIRRVLASGVYTWSTTTSGQWNDSEEVAEPSPPWNFGDPTNAFAAIVDTDDLDLIHGNPGPQYHPDDKLACKDENAPTCIHCDGFDENGDCVDFVDELSGQSVWNPHLPVFDNQNIEPDDVVSREPGNFARGVKCWFDEDGKPWVAGAGPKQPGVVVGFLGGAVNWDDPSANAAVGSVLAVCAPLSSLSYTENWSILNLKGGRVDYAQDSVGGRLGWTTLNEALQYAYELRHDHVNGQVYEHIRPISMKLCPPNTVVSGATWRATGVGTYGPHHVVALSSLSCSPLANNPVQPAALSVSLDASTYPGLAAETLGGAPFLLHQKIGDPTVPFYRVTLWDIVQDCTSSPVATGLETIHDADGRLVYVQLKCGQGQ